MHSEENMSVGRLALLSSVLKPIETHAVRWQKSSRAIHGRMRKWATAALPITPQSARNLGEGNLTSRNKPPN